MGLKLRTRLLALIAGVLLAVTFTAYYVLGHMHERNAEAAAFHSLRSVARFFATHERGDSDKLSAAVDVLLANEEIRRAFAARDRERLLALATPVFEQMKRHSSITHWYFIEPDHTCFLRVHAPELHGDKVERMTLALAEKSGDIGAGKELGRTAFALRVVRPYRDAEGTLMGFMELGEEIDHFLVRMKEQAGDDFGLVVLKRFLDEKAWQEVTGRARDTWNDRPDVVVIDTTTFSKGLVDFQGDLASIPDQGIFLEERREGDKAFIRGAFPVRDAAGRKVGALFVLHDFTEIHEAFEEGQQRGLFVVLGLGLALLVLARLLLDRLVFARVAALEERLKALARRDPPPQAPPRLGDPDELGRLENLVSECEAAEAAEALEPPAARQRAP